ncbi:MAG TPA: LL-diaminopimelate aminotransferase [bacterium]|nr:LL-diaminopimelate aminotransferase [bacterium]
MVRVEVAERIKALPPYLFVRLDQMKSEALARGVDVIDLGIGDPDQATPHHIVDSAVNAMRNPAHHHYPSSYGMMRFRAAASAWMEKRFEVEVAARDVVSLIGSKEGIGHFPLAYLNPGDIALCPSPAYPVYRIGTMFAGGVPFIMPLLEERDFLPDLDAVPGDVADKAKLMFLNYPNNPTAATCDLGFFERAVAFAKRHEIIIVHDNAYSELAFDGYESPSILQVPGAMDCAIELHSLSKSYNMTGWRIGFAAGCAEAVAALGKVKSNLDSGAFEAVQAAAVEAMEHGESDIRAMRETYQRRRDVLLGGLDALGIKYKKPRGSFYVWARTPGGMNSSEWVATLLEQAGIMTSPGSGYGALGEGFFRMALIVDEKRMGEAVERMKKMKA